MLKDLAQAIELASRLEVPQRRIVFGKQKTLIVRNALLLFQAFSRAAKRLDAEGDIHGGQTVRLKGLQVP